MSFKLDDNIRTFYGEKNMTYREALKRGEGSIETEHDWTKRGAPLQYYFRETGSPIKHHVDGRQASSYIKQRFDEIHKKDKWR